MAINIKKDNKITPITEIYHKLKDGPLVAIKYIYHGSQLVWTAIKEAFSAFGAGFWQNDKPWSNEDSWENEE